MLGMALDSKSLSSLMCIATAACAQVHVVFACLHADACGVCLHAMLLSLMVCRVDVLTVHWPLLCILLCGTLLMSSYCTAAPGFCMYPPPVQLSELVALLVALLPALPLLFAAHGSA